jgi:hypothetical protein
MMAQRNIAMQYEDGMIGLWPDGTPFPRMALNVPSLKDGTWKVNPDGTMVTTYYLRKGVKWRRWNTCKLQGQMVEIFCYEDLSFWEKFLQIPNNRSHMKR